MCKLLKIIGIVRINTGFFCFTEICTAVGISSVKYRAKIINRIILNTAENILNIKVSKIADTEKVTILEITQPTEIVVVLFKGNNDTTPIKEGNEVEIIGKVDDYNNKLEIIAQKARIIR